MLLSSKCLHDETGHYGDIYIYIYDCKRKKNVYSLNYMHINPYSRPRPVVSDITT